MGANPNDKLNQQQQQHSLSNNNSPRDNVDSLNDNDSNAVSTSNNKPSLSELHSQNEAQLNAIQSDIEENQPLTSIKYNLTCLQALYVPDSDFFKGVSYLLNHYTRIRRIRGDGNCFYRALLYRVCECLKENEAERQRLVLLVQDSMDEVVKHGYERFALEVFHEELVELLETKVPALSLEQLHDTLNEANSVSDYCTWFLRILCASHLKSDVQRFEAFLELPYTTISAFCKSEVEPMGKDCDMLQIMALAECLKIRIVVEYLDGRQLTDNKLQQHTFGEENALTKVTLLYRPGHYDILYK